MHERCRPAPSSPSPLYTPEAERIRALSIRKWGEDAAVELVGRHPSLLRAQQKLVRFARAESPVLVTGESGVGKEVFARALFLLSRRARMPFLTINCAQYQDENLIVSELFGHKKGSFTGAAADHAGLFESAHGGVLFLDEVGELSLKAQAMLLRALGEGEIKPLGATKTRKVDVRVIAATNRDLETMVADGRFREDLFYRLRYMRLRIPPVRERGDDVGLLVQHFLDRLCQRRELHRMYSAAALATLRAYSWPGNVREIKGIVEMGFCLAEGTTIEPRDFEDELRPCTGAALAAAAVGEAQRRYAQMLEEGASFWNVVREPFLDRELNREQVQSIVKTGLGDAGGSYKDLLEIFRVDPTDYLKFMDFLRHHRLKPTHASAPVHMAG